MKLDLPAVRMLAIFRGNVDDLKTISGTLEVTSIPVTRRFTVDSNVSLMFHLCSCQKKAILPMRYDGVQASPHN